MHPDYFNHPGHADHDPALDANFRPRTRPKPIPHLTFFGGFHREIQRPEAANILRFARRSRIHRPQPIRALRVYQLGPALIQIGP
jgi:hypothetical protein